MDWVEVFSHAEGLIHSLEGDDRDLIASYLAEDLEADFMSIIESIPRPITEGEVLTVTPVDAGYLPSDAGALQYSSVIWLLTPKGELLLSTIWEATHHRLLLSSATILERNPAGTADRR